MESYPEDLLVGVSPLVFAVNAINDDKTKTYFNRFLDAIALVDDHEVLEESSDDEDEADHERHRRRNAPWSSSFYQGLGRRSSARKRISAETNEGISYAKALTSGRGFFQTARIEAISNKHGFPPSKDTQGVRSIPFRLSRALKENAEDQASKILRDKPIEGILPAGWLEKHSHALPSALIVVCTVTHSQSRQDEQDRVLFETVENMECSLAPKRGCKIIVVGVLENDDTTMNQAQAWKEHTLESLKGFDDDSCVEYVGILRGATDLLSNEAGLPASESLKDLHRIVRKTSLLYYTAQAKRNKSKLNKLQLNAPVDGTTDAIPDVFCPLAIRYCFKIAMFYEFQLKHEKSLRFFAEAYRFTARYHEYLRTLANRVKNDKNCESTSHISHSSLAGSGAAETGIETTLQTSFNWTNISPSPPADIGRQCSAVADWLNLKLIEAGLVSHTENGLKAAVAQWRIHIQVFCTWNGHLLPLNQQWLFWLYVAKQRHLFSQLVERHPPKAFDYGNAFDDIILTCSAWRCYEAAAEAYLRLGYALDNVPGTSPLEKADQNGDSMRPPFVGAMDQAALRTLLSNERQVNHRNKALELALHALSLFENEMERERRGFYADDTFGEETSSRNGARLSYLVGSLLLKMERHTEALIHLEKAVNQLRGWREMELAVRRMLILCYDKSISTASQSSGGSQLASMILDSYFNAEMASNDLRRALDHFAATNGRQSLKWFHEVGSDDPNPPFFFHVTFPQKIFATIEESVQATVSIKSNLDYAIHINAITLKSLAGSLSIPLVDILSAAGGTEGMEGKGIIVQRKGEIEISTKFDLPKDLHSIAADESGNGGEILGTTGKGSFATSARPRTAGITSAGGARFLSEDNRAKIDESSQSQGWNLRFLGGKPLRCDGLVIEFFPVQLEKITSSAEMVASIEITMEQKKSRTAANIRRTPFEEENYLSSAWARPIHVPLSQGPRSIRVLKPYPDATLSNLSDYITAGEAIEGTVNCVLLKLQSGPFEKCSEITVEISSFSVLVTPEGRTIRIASDEEGEDCVSAENPIARSPYMVLPISRGNGSSIANNIERVPEGWSIVKSVLRFSPNEIPSLQKGEWTSIPVNFYRPLPDPVHSDASVNYDAALCRTDYYVTVTYRQERLVSETRTHHVGRRARRRPKMSTVSIEEEVAGDHEVEVANGPEQSVHTVSLEYNGSLKWCHPFVVVPSDERHQLKSLGKTIWESDSSVRSDETESISSSYIIKTGNTVHEISSKISSTVFQDIPDGPYDITLLSKVSDKLFSMQQGGVFIPNAFDGFSQFLASYSVQVRIKEQATGAGAPIGLLELSWASEDMTLDMNEMEQLTLVAPTIAGFDANDAVKLGPLRLNSHSPMKLKGPMCHMDSASFVAQMLFDPTKFGDLHVGIPFDISFRLRNATTTVQMLLPTLRMSEERSSFVMSGTQSSEFTIAPNDTVVLQYTCLVTCSGFFQLPTISLKYWYQNDWISYDDLDLPARIVFVFP